MKSSPRFAVGLDLGTSNTVAAVCPLPGRDDPKSRTEPPRPEVPDLLQSGGPGLRVGLPVLPSALYLPGPDGGAADDFAMPWQEAAAGQGRSLSGSAAPDVVAVPGAFAKERASSEPDRVILSAKSWLSAGHVDRTGPILPWKAPPSVPKVSPYDVSRRLLAHVAGSLSSSGPEGGVDVGRAEIVVTVPASFDEAARALTHRAAEDAGLGAVTLLEEPQAAFYDWITSAGRDWNRLVSPGDTILVCDIGGGTADFTLIAAAEEDDGSLGLTRVHVGDHILLGGDNMDLALAHAAAAPPGGPRAATLDRWQFVSLVQGVRAAKETLLSDPSVDVVPVPVPSRGADLFADAVSLDVTREMVSRVVVEGFFPAGGPGDFPAERRSTGLRELGLVYAHDAALTRHLARFLAAARDRLGDVSGAAFPSAVLFNGGVFNSDLLRERVRGLLSEWSGGRDVRELTGTDRDRAVARGAAAYAYRKATGSGLRIRSGVARSYYLGVEPSAPAVPGFVPPVNGLCVVPRGLEEGAEVVIADAEFGLVTGEEVDFRFFTSSERPDDGPGAVVEDAESELEETARLTLRLPASKEGDPTVPVKLHVKVTETGLLDLRMHHTRSDESWKLEWNVREAEA